MVPSLFQTLSVPLLAEEFVGFYKTVRLLLLQKLQACDIQSYRQRCKTNLKIWKLNLHLLQQNIKAMQHTSPRAQFPGLTMPPRMYYIETLKHSVFQRSSVQPTSVNFKC
jgi:hypothetical protein